MKKSSLHLIASRSLVSKEMRETKQNHKGMAFWLTGLSGAGKSTLAHEAEAVLFQKKLSCSRFGRGCNPFRTMQRPRVFHGRTARKQPQDCRVGENIRQKRHYLPVRFYLSQGGILSGSTAHYRERLRHGIVPWRTTINVCRQECVG